MPPLIDPGPRPEIRFATPLRPIGLNPGIFTFADTLFDVADFNQQERERGDRNANQQANRQLRKQENVLGLIQDFSRQRENRRLSSERNESNIAGQRLTQDRSDLRAQFNQQAIAVRQAAVQQAQLSRQREAGLDKIAKDFGMTGRDLQNQAIELGNTLVDQVKLNRGMVREVSPEKKKRHGQLVQQAQAILGDPNIGDEERQRLLFQNQDEQFKASRPELRYPTTGPVTEQDWRNKGWVIDLDNGRQIIRTGSNSEGDLFKIVEPPKKDEADSAREAAAQEVKDAKERENNQIARLRREELERKGAESARENAPASSGGIPMPFLTNSELESKLAAEFKRRRDHNTKIDSGDLGGEPLPTDPASIRKAVGNQLRATNPRGMAEFDRQFAAKEKLKQLYPLLVDVTRPQTPDVLERSLALPPVYRLRLDDLESVSRPV